MGSRQYAASDVEGLPDSISAQETLIKLQRQELSVAARLPQTLIVMTAMACSTLLMLKDRGVSSAAEGSVVPLEFSWKSLKYSGPPLGVIVLLMILGLVFAVPKFRYIEKKK